MKLENFKNIPYLDDLKKMDETVKKYIEPINKAKEFHQELFKISKEIIEKYNYEHLIPKIKIPTFNIESFNEIQKTLNYVSKYKETFLKNDLSKVIEPLHNEIAKVLQTQTFIDLKDLNRFIDFNCNIDFSNIAVNENGTITYHDEVIEVEEIKQGINKIIEGNNLFDYNDFAILPSSKRNIVIFYSFLILINFIFPLMVNISYDFIKNEKQPPQKIIHNKIKIINNYYFAGEKNKHLRVVTAKTLNIRQSPTKKSKITGQLYLDSVVRIIYKKRNWSYIHYENQEGELIEGWVFTRYLKKSKWIK